MNQALATTSQLAEVLGVSRSTVIRWAESGLIPPPHVTVGRIRRWLVADVLNHLRGQTSEAASA